MAESKVQSIVFPGEVWVLWHFGCHKNRPNYHAAHISIYARWWNFLQAGWNWVYPVAQQMPLNYPRFSKKKAWAQILKKAYGEQVYMAWPVTLASCLRITKDRYQIRLKISKVWKSVPRRVRKFLRNLWCIHPCPCMVWIYTSPFLLA